MSRKTTEVTDKQIGRTEHINFLRDEAEGSARLLAYGDTTTLKVYVGEGLVYFGSNIVDFAGGQSGLFANTSASSRIDVVSLNATGEIIITVGTEADSPIMPTVPADEIPICSVYIRHDADFINDEDEADNNGYIDKDLRLFLGNLRRKISIITTDVTVGATTTETNLISVTIPGGTLGIADGVKVRIFFDQFTTAASDRGRFKLKYGATTLITSSEIYPSATNILGYIDILLLAAGATNSQEASIGILFQPDQVESLAAGTKITQHKVGTSAEDSTADKILAVTWQWVAGNAGNAVRMAHAVIEKIL